MFLKTDAGGVTITFHHAVIRELILRYFYWLIVTNGFQALLQHLNLIGSCRVHISSHNPYLLTVKKDFGPGSVHLPRISPTTGDRWIFTGEGPGAVS